MENDSDISRRRTLSRRDFLATVAAIPGMIPYSVRGQTAGSQSAFLPARSHSPATDRWPNILFCIADDWSWPYASIADEPVIQTPAFDRVAREGVLFTNAFVASPSCTPSRGSILTGRWFWQLEEGANLWSTLPSKFITYPDILEKSGYHIGLTRKGWGPGRFEAGGRKRNPAGPSYPSFPDFLKKRPKDKPFCFWFGSHDPHRPYEWQSGIRSGMDAAKVRVPPCLPDCETVRIDLCDYFFEIQRFDSEVGQILAELERIGELENTLVVITGDNGLPFPRCKSNIYDSGTHVPLACRWPKRIPPGRIVEDFISLCDLAPTFLETVGVLPPAEMTGRSFLHILSSRQTGRIDPSRDHVLTGKERHTNRREGQVGYPMRGICTHSFLYIRNFAPDRWPAGDPPKEGTSQEGFGDIDGSPTKTWLLEHRLEPAVEKPYRLSCDKRPAEELYDLAKDPAQLVNVAGLAEYKAVRDELSARLMEELKATNDPRVIGGGEIFDTYPYYGDSGLTTKPQSGKVSPQNESKNTKKRQP